ncbi:MAG: hypothetical protein HY830_15170 [Actinobacteria bacterium]|nr:hypothetical protein [Actinomycetota bacterium]
MFSKNRVEASAQAADLRDRLVPVVEHAVQVAREQAAHAVELGSARLEKGLQAAQPRVEAAADRVAPAVDAARDRIVEDLLPRIVEAVGAAAAAGLAARETAAAKAANAAEHAGDRVSGRVEEAALAIARSTPTARRRAAARRTKILVVAAVAAAVAAGAAAFKRSRGRDPEWEHVPTGVPHSATRTGASENGVGVPAKPPTPQVPPTVTAAPAVEAVTEEPLGDAPGHEVLIDETSTSTETSTDRS